ncbi:MAG: formylglycine-generating enzyme family protein [Planctomycetia bacterium]|nr:formylglycine-generating enzyme family protein [Planctomycetia bacterium]
MPDSNASLPPQIKVDIKDHMSMEFIRIAPGEFEMGRRRSYLEMLPFTELSDNRSSPPFMVSITKGFYIGKHNVKVKEVGKFLNTVNNQQYVYMKKEFAHSQFEKSDDGKYVAIVDGDVPICTIHWSGAEAYCRWLGSISKLAFRLPTEAEWEYAARGPKNIYDTTWEGSIKYPASPTPPNGICDLANGALGNWVQDYYAEYTSIRKTDPVGPSKNDVVGEFRVLRRPIYAITCRSPGLLADDQAWIYGFRLAIDENSIKQYLDNPQSLPDGVAITTTDK